MSKWGKIGYLVSVVSFLLLLVARLIMGGWHDSLWVPFGLCIVAFIAALVVDYKFYLEFLSMKTTKHGMNMGVIIGLCLVLMFALNFLGTRFDKSFDLTKEKLNTLSDQTLSALSTLDDTLSIMVFYRSNEDKEIRSQLKANFQTYLDASPKIKMEYVDALVEVEKAKKYLESQKFAVVLDYKGKRAVVEPPYDEEKTTSALYKVTAKEDKTIFFLTGHGERDIDSEEGENIKAFADELRAEGYKVAKLSLMGGDKMPSATSVIVIAGPKQQMLDAELERLRGFAREGGHLFIAADPGEHSNIAQLTKTLGVEFRNNYILNELEELNGLGPLAALGAEYDRTSEITKKFYKGGSIIGSIFMIASEVERAPDASTSLTFKEIVKTTPKAYTASSPKPVKNAPTKSVPIAIAVNGPVDKIGGTLKVATADGPTKDADDKAVDKDDTKKDTKEARAAKDAKKPEAKDDKYVEFSAIVFGDSDFFSNNFLRLGANRDLVMNSISYLANDVDHISIRPKTAEATPLELTSTKEYAVFFAGIGLPLILIILSSFFWYRRRNL